MLPKIVISGASDHEEVFHSFDIDKAKAIEFEGEGGKIEELRQFLNFGNNVAYGSPEIVLVIWNADKLNNECQTVLLKPLEEIFESTRMYMVVANENGLLPTVVSRCVVVNNSVLESNRAFYWKNILACLKEGPARSLAWVDELDKAEIELVLKETINKLNSGLVDEVNKTRLKIISNAVTCLAEVRFTNINPKLAFGDFLISSWRLVKE